MRFKMAVDASEGTKDSIVLNKFYYKVLTWQPSNNFKAIKVFLSDVTHT